MNRQQRKRFIQKRDKRILELDRKRIELYNILYCNKIQIELEEPVFVGYEKFLIVKKSITDSQTRKDLNEIIELYSSPVFCRDKSFLVKKEHFSDSLWYRTVNYVPTNNPNYKLMEPIVRSLRYDAVKEHLIKYFDFKPVYNSFLKRDEELLIIDTEKYFLTRRRKKYYTHINLPNAEVQRQLDEIEKEFQRLNAYARFYKLYGYKKEKDYMIKKNTILNSIIDNDMKESLYETSNPGDSQ